MNQLLPPPYNPDRNKLRKYISNNSERVNEQRQRQKDKKELIKKLCLFGFCWVLFLGAWYLVCWAIYNLWRAGVIG